MVPLIGLTTRAALIAIACMLVIGLLPMSQAQAGDCFAPQQLQIVQGYAPVQQIVQPVRVQHIQQVRVQPVQVQQVRVHHVQQVQQVRVQPVRVVPSVDIRAGGVFRRSRVSIN